jgi:aspartate kinase
VADAGVNVEMVSYGMKSISLTMLIADADVGAAVGVLHRRLFEEGVARGAHAAI